MLCVKVAGQLETRFGSMDKILHRKINLLIHLAHVDGKFDATEQDLLKSILAEKGLQASYLQEHTSMAVDLGSIAALSGKTELLYWVLKLIHADGKLHPEELNYATLVAKQLGFQEGVIEHYRNHFPQSLFEFQRDVASFQIISPA